MANICFRRVSKSFGAVQIIKGLDLDIRSNEFLVLVGPSGCGKSTILRMLAGLESVTSGEIVIDNRIVNKLEPRERNIAMVFQSYALYPHMTAFDNIAFGLKMRNEPRARIAEKVRLAAETLQLEGLLDRKPKELSGGQRQRVAIGRAIVAEPKVFLFDEPLSNLDAALRVDMRVQLARLHAELDATVVYVTHDQTEAMTLADRIVVLNNGIVEQVGTALELYDRPANLFVAEFIGAPKMNRLTGKVLELAEGNVLVLLDAGTKIRLPVHANSLDVGEPVVVGIRPESTHSETKGDAIIPGVVQVVEPLGGETYIHVQIPDQSLIVIEVDGRVDFKRQQAIDVSLSSDLCHLFDSSGRAVPVAQTSDA